MRGPIRSVRNVKAGQTLIVALIVLFVLLILGFVFLGIVNRNILQSNRSQQRSLAADLAEAGIRYAHNQLLTNALGADWRPSATTPINSVIVGPSVKTDDPDIYFIRPGDPNRSFSDPLVSRDLGGPDGLGNFSRIQFHNGRALVRVRYAPSDVSFTAGSLVTGPLRQPGKTHDYIIIESIGRPGVLNPSDPTTISNLGSVQYAGFPDDASFQKGVNNLSDRDNQFTESRKLMAFASIGLLDDALFITNFDRLTRPAEIGFPFDSGARMFDPTSTTSYPVHVPQKLGGTETVESGGTPIFGGGSIYSNAPLIFYGKTDVTLNVGLREGVFVADKTEGQDSLTTNDGFGPYPAQLKLNVFSKDNAAPVETAVLTNGSGLSSGDAAFDTHHGSFRDGTTGFDQEGNPRGVPYLAPPSILTLDPSTGSNRYVSMTRDSGVILAGGNSGQYGHGRNVYVNNRSDLQTQVDENGRDIAGSAEALFHDWLNPNNGQPNSGWQGPYYVPRGAFMLLEPEGFTIMLDSRAPADQRTWKNPDGTDSGLTTLRFRLSPVDPLQPGLPQYIINTLTPGVNIENPSPSDYQKGQIFDGVILFEGNLRVRGVIPSDSQLTVVSLGNIYIDGSVTKSPLYSNGNRLDHPSRSALGLIAKDYVVVNTTQFFGPEIHQVTEKNSTQNPDSLDPVVMKSANGAINLVGEILLDPNSSPGNLSPTSWQPYATEYKQFLDVADNVGTPVDTQMLLTHTMDDGPAPYTYVSLAIDYGLTTATGDWNYYFNGGASVMYQMGGDNWQRYPKFETRGFPIVQIGTAPQVFASTMQEQGVETYTLNLNRPSTFDFRPNNRGFDPTNDWLAARTAIVPHDVRIEAMLYAQQGSFFVIPGHWFNPNPNDGYDQFNSLTGTTTDDKNQTRLENYGNYPEAPFYGQPLDVKISIVGSVNENMPAPISQQAEWMRKWGWIPREHGSTGEIIPWVHVPAGYDLNPTRRPSGNDPESLSTYLYVPNLTIQYDPVFATGRVNGYAPGPPSGTNSAVRVAVGDVSGVVPMPPLPRLPVSPQLSFFGEVTR